MHNGAAVSSDGRPGLKSTAPLPSMCGATKTALVQLIDGQIGSKRAEIDELMRIRDSVLGSGRSSRD